MDPAKMTAAGGLIRSGLMGRLAAIKVDLSLYICPPESELDDAR
jgi:hypothetical protein